MPPRRARRLPGRVELFRRHLVHVPTPDYAPRRCMRPKEKPATTAPLRPLANSLKHLSKSSFTFWFFSRRSTPCGAFDFLAECVAAQPKLIRCQPDNLHFSPCLGKLRFHLSGFGETASVVILPGSHRSSGLFQFFLGSLQIHRRKFISSCLGGRAQAEFRL